MSDTVGRNASDKLTKKSHMSNFKLAHYYNLSNLHVRLWYNQTHHADHDPSTTRVGPSHCAEPYDQQYGTSSDDGTPPPPGTTVTGGLQHYTTDHLGITNIYEI